MVSLIDAPKESSSHSAYMEKFFRPGGNREAFFKEALHLVLI